MEPQAIEFGPVVPILTRPDAIYCDPFGTTMPPPAPDVADDARVRAAEVWIKAVKEQP